MTFLKLMAKSLVCCTVLYLACGPLTAMAAQADDTAQVQPVKSAAPSVANATNSSGAKGVKWSESYTSPWKKVATQNNATATEDKKAHLQYNINNSSGGAKLFYDALKF